MLADAPECLPPAPPPLPAIPDARVVDHTEVEQRRRVVPSYPAAARVLGLPTTECLTRIHVDTTGVPVGVDFPDCPKVFQAASREAAMASRWYPPRANGVPFEAVFVVTYTFVAPRGP